MKKVILLFASFMFLLVFGCAWVNSTTAITKDAKGNVVESKYSRNVKGFSYDKESATTWADADREARQVHENSSEININSEGKKLINDGAKIRMKNNSSYVFEVTSGEFKGLVLTPGESSRFNRQIPYGVYEFNVKFINDNGGVTEWTVARMITKTTNYIELGDVRR